ncbi:MAG: dephospho-CoA kinase [Planctomycetota bacterium]
MLVIGVAGGVACGKSMVAGQFGRLGAAVLNADEIGHEVLRLEIVKQAVKEEFGDSVFDVEGEIDRPRLGTVVFDSDDDALKRLEQITHPEIRRQMLQQLNQLDHDGRTGIVVLDVPLLFESGYDRLCDKLVFVDVPEAVRVARAMESRGWDGNEISQREAKQMPLAEKKRRCNELIDNSGSTGETFEQVKALWRKWGLHSSEAADGGFPDSRETDVRQ